jgi:hypothetical protein
MHFKFQSGEIWSSGSKGPVVDQERGPFKVDLRLTLESSSTSNPIQFKSYDVSNCEVSKAGKLQKTSVDNAKLLVEGKLVLDEIAKVCGIKFKNAKNLKVVNLHISGKNR